MIIAARQPNFLPWMGYFAMMQRADKFVFLDDVQFTKRSFQNRVRIKGPDGARWLTVPVISKGQWAQSTNQVQIDSTENWTKVHLRSWETAYGRTPYFKELYSSLGDLYLSQPWQSLVEFNVGLIRQTCKILGIQTPLFFSSSMNIPEDRNERLTAICHELGGDVYLHGKGTTQYIDSNQFSQHAIQPILSEFHHPTYSQVWGPFVEGLSIWDVLFNCGKDQTQEWLFA